MSNKPKTAIIKKVNEDNFARKAKKVVAKTAKRLQKEFSKAVARKRQRILEEDLEQHAIPQKPIVKGVRAKKKAESKKLGVTKKKLRKIVIKAKRESKGG